MENKNLSNYVLYLAFLDNKLNSFFQQQKPYIFCKKGCALCCQNADFPYTKTEAEFLLLGFYQLNGDTQQKILDRITQLKKEKSNFRGKKFTYDCPFLIDNICQVYNYRGILCRAFGLLTIFENNENKIPFCAYNGLNFSNVLDKNTNKISTEKYLNSGFEEEPIAFNISHKFLTSSTFQEAFNISFGEEKPLIDHLEIILPEK